MLKKIIVSYKLQKTLHSIEKDDKLIVYIQDNNGNRKKERVIVESFFPGMFKPSVIIVRNADNELDVIKFKDVIQNFSSQRRYKKLLKSVNKKYKYEFTLNMNFKPLSYYD